MRSCFGALAVGIGFLPTAACSSAVLLLGNLQLCRLYTDTLQHIHVPLQHPMSVPFMELLRVLAAALRSTPAWLPSWGHFRAVMGRIRG